MLFPYLIIPLSAVSGTLLSAVVGCIPGFHIYNLMGILALFFHSCAASGASLPSEVLIPLWVGLTVGYAVLNTLPSVLLAAPDESAMFTVLPGQKLFFIGRGLEAVLILTVGAAAGIVVLLVGFGPLAPRLLPSVQMVVRPHLHWILWCVIIFMLMSEWPKSRPVGQAGWGRFLDSWKSTGMGLLTFALSGLLGFILFNRNPVGVNSAFQNLMPALIGLFTVPWLTLNIVSRLAPPVQQKKTTVSLDAGTAFHGVLAGVLGGGFAAFIPVVTGGVGGLLAGHATALRNDRAFLVSQGASKLVYYVGGLLLFFVPSLGMKRGGGAWLLSGITVPYGVYEYMMALSALAIGGAVAIMLVGPLSRLMLTAIEGIGYQRISVAALVVIMLIVWGMTGMPGICITLVSTGIGLLPVLFGTRRMNTLGVILLPMACNMSGIGPAVAGILGLN